MIVKLKRITGLLFVLLFAFGLFGCGATSLIRRTKNEDTIQEHNLISVPQTTTTAGNIHDNIVIPEGGEVGNQCPSFDLSLYFEEGTINPTKSGKVTVVNFWYIFCGGCVHELKNEFPSLHEKYGDEIDVVVVHSYEEYGSDIPAWITKNLPDAGYIHCRDVEGEAFYHSVGGITSWPITFILDENGIVQYRAFTETTFAEMSAVIDGLLAD